MLSRCQNKIYKAFKGSPRQVILARRRENGAGSGSMLRSRRRDVNVKPNRVLDRNSSRGMIYENEELRLRTININAEVERGQHDIKKLRRENETLRREIWSLREEYDRLEALLKSKQHQNDDAEESEDEDSDEKDEADQDNASNQEKVSNKDIDMLSVVEEEPEDNSTEGDGDRMSQQQKREGNTLSEGLPSPFLTISDAAFIEQSGNGPMNGINYHPESIIPPHQDQSPVAPDAANSQGGIPAVFPEDLEQLIRNCTFPVDPADMYRPSAEPNHNFMTSGNNNFRNPRTTNPTGLTSSPPGVPQDPSSQDQLSTSEVPNPARGGPTLSDDLRCQPYAGQSPSFLRLNCVHPHTVFFPVNSPEFSNLTVQEVIDALSDQLPALRGVRLVGGACYLSLATDADAKTLLSATSPLAPTLRGVRLPLQDASLGTAFVALTGVPHQVTDAQVADALAPFATVVEPSIYNQFSQQVQEVIDALSDQLPALRGVRLVGGACYLSLATDADAKTLLSATSPLAPTLRGVRLPLQDASLGTAFVALTGVPHQVTDAQVADALAPFATVVGTVERRIYRGIDTGERLARLRPKLAIPRFLWFGGCRAILRLMKEEEIGALALARRKSFRSHLHIKLKTDSSSPPQVPPLPKVNLGQNSVAQSVPNLVPVTTLSNSPPLIGFSTTQSVPDLTVQPPPQPQKPQQFFSSTTGASNNVFLFPPPGTPLGSPGSSYRRHSSIVPPSLGNQPQMQTGSLGGQTHNVQPSGHSHNVPNGNVPNVHNGNIPNVHPHNTNVPSVPPLNLLGGADSGTHPHHQRSQSTPPVPNPNPSPLPTRRQNSQSDSEAPKQPDTPKTRRISRKLSKTGSQPNLTPLDTKKANGDASSSSGQDSPSKPSRRRASVYFKRPGSFRRQTSMDGMEGGGEMTTTCSERERSNSDVSSRTSGGCRRKMSETGREVGKVPWCGCWGNGCL
ncbi:uncharacterized protein LOC111056432 [Nilaparvata lugens]|uniref:uncharacterized protein LOC111056432 n=1 Tax=Nilaparvata lugens TaxID=108931 RepID=UPI00193D4194|nr:uncharacterized protein LOC111056432 [Nilaparvata lugens]